MLFIIILYSSILSAHGFLINRHHCPSTTTYSYSHLVKTENKCYEFILNVREDWVTAQLDCRKKGGRLVTIENSHEQHRINNWLKRLHYNTKGVWIGLNDIQNEGTFVWDSGKPVTYKNWGQGQPDDYRYNQHQDCVLLYVPHHFENHPDGQYAIYNGSPGWHDQLCQDTNGDREDAGWICEYDVPPTPLHPMVPNHQSVVPNTYAGCPSTHTHPSERTIIGNKCYELILFVYGDWDHAHKDCHSKGGFLVTIESKQEETLLMDRIESTRYRGRGVWIGLHDQNQEGHFVWDSGRPVTYTNWEPGQPDDNHYSQNQDCVLMYMPWENPNTGSLGWHDQICIHHNQVNTELDGWICEYYIGAATTKTIPTPSMKASTITTTAATTLMPTTVHIKTTTTLQPSSTTTIPVTTTTSTPTTTTTLSTTSTPTTTTKATTTPTTTPTTTTSSTTSTTPTTTTTGVKTTTTPLPFIIGKRKINV